MGYVAVEPVTAGARLAGAGARWEAIVLARPDLEPAVGVQRLLVGILVELTDVLTHGRLPRLSLPPRYLAAKLGRGIPMLTGEPIPLPVAVVKPTLLRLCEALAAGGAGEAARHVHAALAETRIDAGSLLGASLARDQEAIRTGAMHRGLAPDLLWLVAELAISPFAHALQLLLLAPAPGDAELRRALGAWAHGYCPACGSWPALAEIAGGRRMLRCSFCALAWDPPGAGCAYCGGDRGTLSAPHAGDRACGRVEICSGCGGYLKAVDVETLSPFPLVAIADLETVDLDTAAMERGFGRPGLRTFGQQPREHRVGR